MIQVEPSENSDWYEREARAHLAKVRRREEVQRRAAMAKIALDLAREGVPLADAAVKAAYEVARSQGSSPTVAAWASARLAELTRARVASSKVSPAEAALAVSREHPELMQLRSSSVAHLPVEAAVEKIKKALTGATDAEERVTLGAWLAELTR